MSYVQALKSLRHSGDTLETASHPEDTSILVTLILQSSRSFPIRRFQLRSDNNKPSLVSTIRPQRQQITLDLCLRQITFDLCLQLRSSTPPACITCQLPPVWAVTDRDRFLCMQSQQSNAVIMTVTTSQHVQLRGSRRIIRPHARKSNGA